MRMVAVLVVTLLLALLAPAQQEKKPLTNADVVAMVQGGLDESTIILAIKSSPCNFDTSALALIELKKKGVNQNILNALLNAAPPASAPAASPANSDAAALMARVVEALGGEGPLSGIKAIRYRSTRYAKLPTGDTVMDMEQTTVYPDRIRITLKWPQFSTVSNVSPGGSFILVNGKEQPFPPESLREFEKSVKLGNINIARHARDPRYSFVIKGQEQIGNYNTSILEISVDGDMVRWNVDTASGRLVRTTRSTMVGGTAVVSVSDYSDWHTVDGITVPFRIMSNGVLSEEHKSFEVNPVLPPNLFDKPSGSAAVQTASAGSCPIEILKVDPHAIVFGTSDPWGWELKVKYRNVGQKEIVAEKFGADFFDVTHDRKHSAWDYTAGERLKPGEVKAPHWNDGVYVNELGLRLNAEAWPIKLVFADGTSWQNDDSHQCKAASWEPEKK